MDKNMMYTATSKQLPASWPWRNQGFMRSLLRLGVGFMELLLLARSNMASFCSDCECTCCNFMGWPQWLQDLV